MINYNDVYEILRKEKYSETLQTLSKSFLSDFASFLNDLKSRSQDDNVFSDSAMKIKKQIENSLALFRELVLRRKKKLLNLVFVAAETGIMKKDYENMLDFERQIFEKLVKSFEEGDKELARILQGNSSEPVNSKMKMILFNEDVEQFVDMSGNTVGPFNSGQMANLDDGISSILVSSGKASFVDD